MPMNYASQASVTPTSGTTITVSKPTGTVDGDVLIAMISVRASSSSTITAPSGWTLVGSAGTASSTRTAVYYRVAGTSEPTSYQWTSDLAITDAVGLILRYTPSAPTTPPGSVDATGMGSLVSPAVAPSVTATGNNDRLIALFSSGTPGSVPTGMTQRAAIDGGNSGAWAYDQLLTAIGATGTRTWTGSGSGVGWSVALLGFNAGNRVVMMI